MKSILTEDDHNDLSQLLTRVLEAYASGELSTIQVSSGLEHMIGAIATRNRTEIDSWVQQDGISLFKKP